MEGHLTYGLRSRKATSVGFVSGQIVLAALMVPSGFDMSPRGFVEATRVKHLSLLRAG